ncbi:MAG TPA: hypothetical protein EYG46_07710, partial [Myxococcales bacterium]|nr:hypothetical protein [Myxococcales bacterium]
MVLVVECGKCGTRFQFDASRIPDDGIRVRCSRCKHAFFLQHPSQSQAGAVNAVAQQAVENESLASPSTTHDLAGATDPGQSVAVAAGNDAVDDEEDWEFNEDPLPDDDDGDIDLDDLNPDDLDEDVYDANNIQLADPDAETVMNESSGMNLDGREMGADDLASSNMSVEAEGIDDAPSEETQAEAQEHGQESAVDETPDDNADAPGPGFGGEREEDAFGSMDEYSGDEQAGDVTASAVTAPSADQENIEDPESWDFFGDDAGPAPAHPTMDSAVQRQEVDAQTREINPEVVAFDAESEWRAYNRQGPIGAVVRISAALLSVGVFVALGAGIYLGVIGSLDSGVHTPAFVDIGSLRAANIRGQWVETENVGTVYVVSGDLLNPGIVPASPEHAVRVTLLGQDGNALDAGSAYAGTGLNFDALRMIAPGDISLKQVSAAQALAIHEIAPGDSIPITATFTGLPDEATHFALNAVEP